VSDDSELIRETARDFAQKRLAPIAQAIDEDEAFPRELFNEMGQLGLLGLGVPEIYGGTGATFLSAAIAMEELSRVSAAVALSYGAHAFLCAHNLYANADEAMRKKYLPKLCSGEWIGAFALTEPEAGSDAASLQTTAKKNGSGYVLNGAKMFITNGSIADLFLVFARTERRPGVGPLSAFLVEREFKGLNTSRDIKKLGTRGSPLSEVLFQDCAVPAGNLIGEEGKGLNYMLRGLDMERAVFSGMAVGLVRASLDYSLNYACQRRQFKQPVASFQLVQEMLAQMATDLEAGRLLVYQAATMLDEGKTITKEASIAKLFVAQMAIRCTQMGVQILGGVGFTRECPVERYYRDAALLPIGGGTSQIQQLIIAKAMIKEHHKN